MAQPTKLYCHNGKHLYCPETTPNMRIRTVRPTYDEGTIHSHLPIPAEIELQIMKCYQNLYGTFIDVEHQGRKYSIKPKHVEVL